MESRIQINVIHIICGTVWKCSTECGLSVHSNEIVFDGYIVCSGIFNCFFVEYYTAVLNLSVEATQYHLWFQPYSNGGRNARCRST